MGLAVLKAASAGGEIGASRVTGVHCWSGLAGRLPVKLGENPEGPWEALGTTILVIVIITMTSTITIVTCSGSGRYTLLLYMYWPKVRLEEKSTFF